MKSSVNWRRDLRLDEDNGSAPRYVRLQEQLRRIVESLPPGSPIPGEVECAAMAGVSRETVRKAMSVLVSEGLLTARRGCGTFTSTPHLEAGLNRVQSFNDAVMSKGRRPSTVVVRLDREPANFKTSEALKIVRNAEVWVLERVRWIDEEPAMVETAHLPADRFPRLDTHDLTASLYRIMRESYGLAPEFGSESIYAVNASRALARQLDIPIASALLASVRDSQTSSQIRLEHTHRYVRPELCSYNVILADTAGLSVRLSDDLVSPAPSTRKTPHVQFPD